MKKAAIAWIAAGVACLSGLAQAQNLPNKFQPFTYEWPNPDEVRLASGAPGPKYWQQRADYSIKVGLEEEDRRVSGEEWVTYHNNSPHTLTYLWVQLDQNKRNPHSVANEMQPASTYDLPDFFEIHSAEPFDGGMEINFVHDVKGGDLNFHVVETNMRIDLPQPLKPGEKFQFSVEWSYNLNDATLEGRSGYEHFEKDENQIFEIAQFHPRMCTYTSTKGWQNTPFFGPAEFGLEFGDFHVEISVPSDHIVSATGELMNAKDVLEKEQLARLADLKAKKGILGYVVTPQEAAENEKKGSGKVKTWIFEAKNVRDFAFASSRKFIWDATYADVGNQAVWVQSFYPNEAATLYSRYSTHAALHTLRVYSRLTLDYPYPTCNVVNGPVWGMEYPMMAFCGGRPTPDGYYSNYVKYATISVIMHEVGHNFFPMIVNSDERGWAWMDEGLNSFCQFIAEQEFEPNYPSRRGFPEHITGYMSSTEQNPIMTNPESIIQNGSVSYEKTAVGLNIMRETIMGREVFDRAFKEYSLRWAWKHPEPCDFFRTMEDASGVDLDWFWRTWFYSTEAVDIGIGRAEKEDAGDPYSRNGQNKRRNPNITTLRNQQKRPQYYVDGKPDLKDEHTGNSGDLYNGSEMIKVDSASMRLFNRYTESGDHPEGKYRTKVKLINVGGAPMPVTLQILFTDGTAEILRLPVQIWIKNNPEFLRELVTDKEVSAVLVDPFYELPDINRDNNYISLRP